MTIRRRLFAAVSIVAIGLASGAVLADPLDDILYPADSNGVLPVERILDQARNAVAGTVLEIELEREHGRLVYEVLILTADNRKIEIEYDARTGAELSREVKKARSRRG
ncbi:MAG: PepSY domain-containing protein [Methylocystis sp.]|uniref:PepSY domain-containing protein n=1 Tax=Methylocystis sp. TaxID=1911079 RepID=UPI003D0A7600